MIVFASDLDGTLVFDGKVKEEDLQSIRKFQATNKFGACTGRGIAMLHEIFPLNLDFYIVSSGAMIVDNNQNIIKTMPMKQEDAISLFHEYKEKATIIIQTDNRDTFYATQILWGNTVISSLDEITNETIYSVSLIVDSDEIAYNYNKDIEKKYPDVIGHQNKNSIDIVYKDCSKGNALKWMQDYYQADMSCAIGDSYNDLSMIASANQGFTFDYAPDILKQQATVVSSVNEAIDILGGK